MTAGIAERRADEVGGQDPALGEDEDDPGPRAGGRRRRRSEKRQRLARRPSKDIREGSSTDRDGPGTGGRHEIVQRGGHSIALTLVLGRGDRHLHPPLTEQPQEGPEVRIEDPTADERDDRGARPNVEHGSIVREGLTVGSRRRALVHRS